MNTYRLSISLLLGFGLVVGVTLAISGSQPAEAAVPAQPPPNQAIPQDATAEWWLETQTRLRLDMEPLSVPDGSADWTATGENSSNYLGVFYAAGDINDDGYTDIVAGAPGYSNFTGRFYVYYGSAMGLSATPALTVTGENEYDEFGRVAMAGDVNGDDYADVIVSAYRAGSSGRVYVYYGSSEGLSATPAFTATGEYAGDEFGGSVATAGDVNGDGYADIAVGAMNYGPTDQGKIYVYHGGSEGPNATPAFTTTGESTGDEFGSSIMTAGDVDGDGYADFAIGIPGYNGSRGRVYVYNGSSEGLNATPAFTATGENAGDLFCDVATAGDVNGDGYADIIVGAYGHNDDHGKVYVYHGSSDGLNATPAFTATGEHTLDAFGASVATAGDVNGDGYTDIIVGADGYPSGNTQGKVYVYLGSSEGLSTTLAFTATGENIGDRFGLDVGAGDVNGDGYADVIVGAHGYPSGNGNGRIYVYHAGPPKTYLPLVQHNALMPSPDR